MSEMRTMRIAFLLALSMSVSAAAYAASFKVIVNTGIRTESLPKKSVSDLFMKKTARWNNGTTVVPVDQAEAVGVRDEFSKSVHGKPTAAVKSYWNQQIFSGREVPPIEKRTDAEVLAFVRSTAGAVGYISVN